MATFNTLDEHVDPDSIGFEAADPADRRRLMWGKLWHLGVWSRILTMAHRTPFANVAHRLERRWARSLLRHLDVKLDVQGMENIPDHPCVIVPLHEGLLDPAIVFTIPLEMRFLVRDEIFGWPLLREYLGASRQIQVATNGDLSSSRSVLARSGATLRNGQSVVVFAQGSVLGLEVAFKDGPRRIASHHGVPILPVVITGTHRVWEHPYSPTVRYGKTVSMRILPPLDTCDEGDFADLQSRMKDAALAPDMAPVRRFEPDRDGWWEGYDYEIDPDFPDLAARLAAFRSR